MVYFNFSNLTSQTTSCKTIQVHWTLYCFIIMTYWQLFFKEDRDKKKSNLKFKMIIFIHMYMNVDRISTISLPYIFESFYGTINTLFWSCRKFYDIYLIETCAIVIDITAHGDESSRRVDVEQARSLVITNNWVSHNIEWRLEETESNTTMYKDKPTNQKK